MYPARERAHIVQPQGDPRWAIAAPVAFLRDAADHAGLDHNALREDFPGVRDGEAWLVLPSFFCETPVGWLRALAHLVERQAPLRLYMLYTDPQDPEVVEFSVRLYPRLDAEIRTLIGTFSQSTAAAVDDVGALVELAFRRLREAPVDLD